MTDHLTANQVMESPRKSEILTGKYLTFKIGDEMYGVQISKIQEVLRIMDITRIPKMPAFIRGVINLREKVIPVAELRLKFGLDTLTGDRACIVVIEIIRSGRQVAIGIIVDEISEVLNIDSNQIEETPSFGLNVDTPFIRGIGKVKEKVIVFLDIDKVLSDSEITLVEAI